MGTASFRSLRFFGVLVEKAGPYLLLELLLPGGTLVALVLYVYRRQKTGSGARVTAAVNSVPFEALPSLPKRAKAHTHAASSQPASNSSRTFAGRAALMAFVVWMLFESWGIVAALVDQREGGWLAAAAAAVAILLSSLVSSIAGFAFSAIAGSALAYLNVEPVRAVQMMVVCSIATQFYAVWSIRESIRWRSVLSMIGAGAMTIPLGVWLLLHVDAVLYAAGLGAFLTAYGCYIAFRRESLDTRDDGWRGAVAGALGGLTGGLAGIPGAPVTIWCSMRGWDKLRQRAVYQPYILVMQMATITCLRWQAPERAGIVYDLKLVPFALVGAVCGLAVFRRMSNRQFQVAVSVLLVVSGVGLLARML